MNPNTNDLIDYDQLHRDFEGLVAEKDAKDHHGTAGMLDEQRHRLEELSIAIAAASDPDIEPLPEGLLHAARCALQGQAHVVISRQSKGKLSKHGTARRRQLGRQQHRG